MAFIISEFSKPYDNFNGACARSHKKGTWTVSFRMGALVAKVTGALAAKVVTYASMVERFETYIVLEPAEANRSSFPKLFRSEENMKGLQNLPCAVDGLCVGLFSSPHLGQLRRFRGI